MDIKADSCTHSVGHPGTLGCPIRTHLAIVLYIEVLIQYSEYDCSHNKNILLALPVAKSYIKSFVYHSIMTVTLLY